jgi:hypothetical protein
MAFKSFRCTENAQQKNEEEVKKRFFDLSDKNKIYIQEDNYLTLDDSIKSIFRYYKEHVVGRFTCQAMRMNDST